MGQGGWAALRCIYGIYGISYMRMVGGHTLWETTIGVHTFITLLNLVHSGALRKTVRHPREFTHMYHDILYSHDK
jgi:hypothetical protein